MTQPHDGDTLRVFEPDDPREAVQGWALHATRRRNVHEAEARFLNSVRYWLGSSSTILAAVAGTSAFAAWQSTTSSLAWAIVTAVIGIGAAILGGLLTFLDPGGLSEAHRRSATAYKSVLREFEEAAGSVGCTDGTFDRDLLRRLKSMLADADTSAPTVPRRRGRAAEREPFIFVPKALNLFPNPPNEKPPDNRPAEPDDQSRPANGTRGSSVEQTGP